MQCVGLLLRFGCNKNAEDKHGGIPLDYAQQGHHSKCCQLLTNHDPNNPVGTSIPETGGNLVSECLIIRHR